jgi:hypothetical protein
VRRALRVCAFLVVTYVAGGLIAKAYLESAIEIPGWLRYATVFLVRLTGVEPEHHTEEVDIMLTFLVSCISWTLTGLMLWLVMVEVQRVRNREP